MIIPYPYDRTGAGAAIPSGGAVLGEHEAHFHGA